MNVTNAVEILDYATLLRKENLVIKAENAKLRKVVDAARSVAGFDPCHDANSYWSIKKLSNALDEYDKAKEGQE